MVIQFVHIVWEGICMVARDVSMIDWADVLSRARSCLGINFFILLNRFKSQKSKKISDSEPINYILSLGLFPSIKA